MPRKDTTSINTNLTPEQVAVVKALAEADGGIAQYLRRLLAQDAERHGINWPELVGRGKYPRQPDL